MGNKYFVSLERERIWVEDKALNDRKDIYLAICLRDGDKCIGYTSINNIDYRNRNASWGSIFIDDSERKKGLSIDVGKLLLKLVFEEMPIHRFYSYILDGHTASLRMVEKLGFKTEGMMKECVYKLNKFHDAVCVYMLEDDYQKLYHDEIV
jgi:RimJ/RimL family protein N-acetyltransferase